MKIADIMTRDVHLIATDESVEEAARRMMESDVGIFPIGDRDRLIGTITDRDIVVCAVAQGNSPDSTAVRDVMDDKVEKANESMEKSRIRHTPIVNRDKRLVGIVSLGNFAADHDASRAGQTLRAVV